MKDILISNIFLIAVVLGYTVFVANHFFRFKKLAGNKVGEYKHNSTVKTMGYVMLAIGVFYVVMFILQEKKTPSMIFTFALFVYFVTLVSFISIKNILMYENGLIYSGKFLLYQDMMSIEKLTKKGINIKMQKKGLSDTVYINKVEDEKTFISDVKKRMKFAKKGKKITKKIEQK
ncbi:MAG: hypothetical protein ACTTKD_03050 [Peptoanaerobacter stomatis]|uniref:hypothetical protein n=1 Tax=Peptoanaerobacter stomatis TaxID=796937 RepID=UPI003F9FD51A